MAYTIGPPGNIRGTYWMQKPRQTLIDRLSHKVREALQNYHSSMGNYPSHLIVYRSGISEGEYGKVFLVQIAYFKYLLP